jgi:glucosamine kinase
MHRTDDGHQAMTELYAGVDGGATRARVLVTDSAGNELVRREGGAAIVRPEDPALAAATVAALVRAALDAVRPGATATALCCGLAGASRDVEAGTVRAALETAGIAQHILVVTDAHTALHDAFGAGPGLLLIAGTGSVAWGRGEHGRMARVGGWGQLLGDEGSGYALGLDGLRSVMRAHDVREPATPLHAALLRATGCSAPTELVGWAALAAKADIAALSGIVSAHAAAGDAAAGPLIRAAADALARHVRALHDQLRPWSAPPAVALAGGFAVAAGPLHDALVAALAADERRFRLHGGTVDAARGGAALARELHRGPGRPSS